MALSPLSLDDLRPMAKHVVVNYAVVYSSGDGGFYRMGYSVQELARAQKWKNDFLKGEKEKFFHILQRVQAGEYTVHVVRVEDVQSRTVTFQ